MCADLCSPATTHIFCRMACPLDSLSLDLLAKVLGLSSSQTQHNYTTAQQLQPRAVGQLMLTCKRFLEATSCAAFWQDLVVRMPTTTLYHPCHAPLIARLTVEVEAASTHSYSGDSLPTPGLVSCYQPLLPRLKVLHVSAYLCVQIHLSSAGH